MATFVQNNSSSGYEPRTNICCFNFPLWSCVGEERRSCVCVPAPQAPHGRTQHVLSPLRVPSWKRGRDVDGGDAVIACWPFALFLSPLPSCVSFPLLPFPFTVSAFQVFISCLIVFFSRCSVMAYACYGYIHALESHSGACV